MYRKVEDFIQEWKQESQLTLSVLQSLTDEKLGQAIEEGHNTLGWLGWHLTTSPVFFVGQLGLNLNVDLANKQPSSASVIKDSYDRVSKALLNAVEQVNSDAFMEEELEALGATFTKGAMLRLLLNHQAHHRGQMIVLLRQAGLTVPGLYGPTKEQSR
ncbi:damage-inducible protein DinB [Alkalicoccobacillus plakortidis]|uniref:Damage-inducible protein DinB n=2 Tax=Bacillaceae TaxID=186817 RepID=A0A9D5I1F0_9BACI|nr:DinB family protein [Shouchella oshimensis]KQL57609.1 damage-inducible protein DinB [Alkalicoccobacillus plakortidis]